MAPRRQPNTKWNGRGLSANPKRHQLLSKGSVQQTINWMHKVMATIIRDAQIINHFLNKLTPNARTTRNKVKDTEEDMNLESENESDNEEGQDNTQNAREITQADKNKQKRNKEARQNGEGTSTLYTNEEIRYKQRRRGEEERNGRSEQPKQRGKEKCKVTEKKRLNNEADEEQEGMHNNSEKKINKTQLPNNQETNPENPRRIYDYRQNYIDNLGYANVPQPCQGITNVNYDDNNPTYPPERHMNGFRHQWNSPNTIFNYNRDAFLHQRYGHHNTNPLFTTSRHGNINEMGSFLRNQNFINPHTLHMGNPKCFICNRVGHFARNCRFRQ